MKKNIKLPYRGLRLLLLQRAQYRSKFTGLIRRGFNHFGANKLYTHYFGYFFELIELIRRNKIVNEYIEDIQTELNSIKSFIPPNPQNILDIGAGLAGIDLLLYHQLNSEPTIYILDKDGVDDEIVGGYHKSEKGFSNYHSFEITCNFLMNNKIPSDKIVTVDINREDFPVNKKFDLVISLLAWGFHFPVKTYLKDVYDSLNKNGKLIIDIRKKTAGLKVLKQQFNNNFEILLEKEKFFRIGIQK